MKLPDLDQIRRLLRDPMVFTISILISVLSFILIKPPKNLDFLVELSSQSEAVRPYLILSVILGVALSSTIFIFWLTALATVIPKTIFERLQRKKELTNLDEVEKLYFGFCALRNSRSMLMPTDHPVINSLERKGLIKPGRSGANGDWVYAIKEEVWADRSSFDEWIPRWAITLVFQNRKFTKFFAIYLEKEEEREIF